MYLQSAFSPVCEYQMCSQVACLIGCTMHMCGFFPTWVFKCAQNTWIRALLVAQTTSVQRLPSLISYTLCTCATSLHSGWAYGSSEFHFDQWFFILCSLYKGGASPRAHKQMSESATFLGFHSIFGALLEFTFLSGYTFLSSLFWLVALFWVLFWVNSLFWALLRDLNLART